MLVISVGPVGQPAACTVPAAIAKKTEYSVLQRYRLDWTGSASWSTARLGVRVVRDLLLLQSDSRIVRHSVSQSVNCSANSSVFSPRSVFHAATFRVPSSRSRHISQTPVTVDVRHVVGTVHWCRYWPTGHFPLAVSECHTTQSNRRLFFSYQV